MDPLLIMMLYSVIMTPLSSAALHERMMVPLSTRDVISVMGPGRSGEGVRSEECGVTMWKHKHKNLAKYG